MATKVKHMCPHTNRPIFCKRKCKSCYWNDYMSAYRKKKSPVTGEPVKIPRVSANQKQLNKAYAILCAELKPLHQVCEGKLDGCTHRATEIHHKCGRIGILLILSTYFGYLCNNCHRFCTDNSLEAIELGLSMPINSKIEIEFTERELQLIEQFYIKHKVK